MKTDISDFGKLKLSQFFNFGDQRCDPFLVQMSLSDRIVAGVDVKLLKQRKLYKPKQILPLTEDEVAKVRVCEEMIMFEREGEG